MALTQEMKDKIKALVEKRWAQGLSPLTEGARAIWEDRLRKAGRLPALEVQTVNPVAVKIGLQAMRDGGRMFGVTDPIIAFYLHKQPDNRGRRLADILSRDDDWLEHTHDYIQWLFPLPEPSGSNPHAPLLHRGTMAMFRSDAALRDGVQQAFQRMLSFYGLRECDGSVDKGANWDDRKDNWATKPTHNDLRITRILRSLCLLGLRDDAEAFKACLLRLARDPECDFDEGAVAYWRGATASIESMK